MENGTSIGGCPEINYVIYLRTHDNSCWVCGEWAEFGLCSDYQNGEEEAIQNGNVYCHNHIVEKGLEHDMVIDFLVTPHARNN